MKYHGLLLVHKPSGLTSHEVVARARRILGTKEVGHAGTLDPLASGLLVLLIGQGTKISDYVLTGDKGYRVRVKFGISTDTYDTDGQILEQRPVQLDPLKIRAAAESLTGEFEWPVPAFSAVKVGGEKLYELARQGKDVTPPVKKMSFWGIRPLRITEDELEAEIFCSKGSYIRSWAVELGRALGVPSVMSGLERIYSAPFHIRQATTLEELEKWAIEPNKAAPQGFFNLSAALPHFLTMTVRGRDEKLMLSGQVSFDLERRLIFEQKEANRVNRRRGVKVIGGNGQILSILEIQPFHRIKIKRVFKGLDAAL